MSINRLVHSHSFIIPLTIILASFTTGVEVGEIAMKSMMLAVSRRFMKVISRVQNGQDASHQTVSFRVGVVYWRCEMPAIDGRVKDAGMAG